MAGLNSALLKRARVSRQISKLSIPKSPLPNHSQTTMTSTSPIRVAVLEADIPIDSVRTKYGSYGAVFSSLLHKAADASNLPRSCLYISGWDVINSEHAPEGEIEEMGGEWYWKRRRGYPRLEDVDAVLITGSRMWVKSSEAM